MADMNEQNNYLKVTALPTPGEQNEVEMVLKEAMEMNYDEVIVIGIKDKEVRIGSSKTKSTMQRIGILETAKLEIFSKWT